MKSPKYTLAVSLLAVLWSVAPSSACWYPQYLPKGYYMYRVINAEQKDEVYSEFNPNAANNCREWQRYTSPGIPLNDIYKAVYKMPLKEFEQFHKNRRSYRGSNAFLKWLGNNAEEVSEFLLFAKKTELVRSHQSSRWYYPSMKIKGVELTLEDIAKEALAYRGPLRDRYLLQAVRALFSMHHYAECIALWDDEANMLPKESVMRQLILPYIAGAEYRMQNYDKAAAYFYETGNIGAMLSCTGEKYPQSTVETIERIYDYAPNSRFFPKLLHEFVRQAEPDGEMYRDEDADAGLVTDEHRQLARLAVRIAREGKTDNPAMWYYTAAFIEDLQGHTAKASDLLTKAEQSQGTELVKESVKVMRIYLDAKTLPYNQAYENRLFGQLQWLDRKIADNITDEVRKRTATQYDLWLNTSYYYWNDMMRRIVLSEVCPRMIAAGRPIRALQLANMADNRLLGLVDCRVYHKMKNGRIRRWDCNLVETTGSMREFRREKNEWSPDYSNSFFEMIDSIGINLAIAYRNRIGQPLGAFDRFLNERGYVDMEYIDDIVGTQCLRTMRYGDAVSYLGHISRSFEGHLNTEILYEPFSYKRQEIKDKSDFKYRFAREMWLLEQEMSRMTDPNRKAETMFRYAIGLRNSFTRCWPLTQYYFGTSFFGQVQEKRNWTNEPEAILAMQRSCELFRQACSLFTDKELAAKALYELNQFRTVAEQYPETEMGQYVIGHCDNLRDYELTPEY